ncbi:MAG: shikimate kinase [Robiginitomaculum sp.]|nr:MAG: shikimate kinase [Robiginitomaculum sp.]
MQNRSIVLIGLMGVGKTTIGRRLAAALGLVFHDADHEIEKSAGRSVQDIFADFGEPAFRAGERKVILRLLQEKPCVLATGGGAFMDQEIREAIAKHATSIWLRAELDELVRRTAKRDTRPLLQNGNRRKILHTLMQERHPVYAAADLVVDSSEGPHTNTVEAIIQALQKFERPAS